MPVNTRNEMLIFIITFPVIFFSRKHYSSSECSINEPALGIRIAIHKYWCPLDTIIQARVLSKLSDKTGLEMYVNVKSLHN